MEFGADVLPTGGDQDLAMEVEDSNADIRELKKTLLSMFVQR